MFGLWETFSYFWRQSYGSLVKISLYIFDERFGEKQLCCGGAQIFHQFRNASKRFWEFSQEFWGRVVTTAFCVPRWNFFLIFEKEKRRKNYFFSQIAHCYHFQTLSEKIFSTFEGMVAAGLSKNRCTCSDEVFDKEIFWKSY